LTSTPPTPPAGPRCTSPPRTTAGAVAALIAAGAEINAQNRFGAASLSVAVFNSMGCGEAIQLLLDAGADPDRRNSVGISRAPAQ
jgi:ankyrin repeat protein